MANVAAYTAPARQVGDSGFTTDVTAALRQVQAMNVYINSLGAVSTFEALYAKDFGVQADGVSDDTDAMRSAISAAVSQGKTLYVQTGTVRVRCARLKGSSTPIGLEMPSNLKLRGMGFAATIFKALDPPAGITFTPQAGAPTTNAEFMWLLWSQGKSNIDVSGVGLHGNLAAMPFSPNPYLNFFGTVATKNEAGGCYFEGGTNNRITQASATQCGGYGFRWDSSTNGYGQFLTADNCVNGGLGLMQLSNGARDCAGTIVENFIFQDNHSDQIRFHTNNTIARHGVASFSKRNPGTYGPAVQNFAGVYWERATNCLAEDIRMEGNSSFGFDMWIGAPGDYYVNGTYNNAVATDNPATTGNSVIGCQLLANANGGARLYQHNAIVQRGFIYNNGERVVNGVAYVDTSVASLYHPYGVHVVPGKTGVRVLDTIFRCDNGRQTIAIAAEDGSINFSGCTFSRNHATGQLLFPEGTIPAGNDVQDNFPISQNGYTRVTTKRSSVPSAAYVSMPASGTAIQWNWATSYNAQYTVPAGQGEGTQYTVQTSNTPASGTGQLKITNNSNVNQNFTIPGTNHYMFGSPTKTVSIAPGHEAYFQVDIYAPAEGNYVNWFYKDQLAGAAPVASTGIVNGTIIAVGDNRIKPTNYGTRDFTILKESSTQTSYVFGTGQLRLDAVIPAGLFYEVYGYKARYFGTFAIFEGASSAAAATGINQFVDGKEVDGSGLPELIYRRPVALAADLAYLDLRFEGPTGQTFNLTHFKFTT